MPEYESFCIYGFRTVYPATWRIQLDPKSKQSEGNVTFRSPEKSNIVVNWGPLEKAKNKYCSLEEHVGDSISRIKNDRKVKKVELVQTKNIQVNSHKAILSQINLVFSIRKRLPLGKTRIYEQEVHSLHFYCSSSKRYFVIYEITTTNKSLQQKLNFKNIIKSFVCHNTKEIASDKST